MPPHSSTLTGVLDETDAEIFSKTLPAEVKKPEERTVEIVWKNVVLFTIFHVISFYGIYLMFASASIFTSFFAIAILYPMGGLGITAAVHRLWSHRAYKAALPLRLLLVFFNTLVFENSVIEWARDHRLHHKYTDTDADPHNSTRGFFFSHVGWLLVRKHPEVKNKGKSIDISDLLNDPVLAFQHNYYFYVMPLVCFVLPTAIPMYFWNETFVNSFCLNMLRYVMTLHFSWFVNSAAHMWGNKPYDKYVYPVENLFVSMVALGEGWHNFHHTFPWDYKTSELGKYSTNVTTAFLDFMAKIGWAYDFKMVSDEMVKNRAKRTGDGTHKDIWGWGDPDQAKEDYDEAIITHRKDM